MNFKHFSYQFDAGPLSTEEELSGAWNTGNCRRMLQWYFYSEHGVFLTPEHILCPDAYYKTGEYLFEKGQEVSFRDLRRGDVIYAQRILSKDGNPVDKSEKTFATTDDYIVSLHTALYVGEPGKEILHATSVEGGSCQWPLERFVKFYHPVAVKRVIAQ